jgi:LysR family nitrogen assimilation transcriptional regulator
MDLRQLRYFVGIVENGSVSRAAEVLRVAQPALSQHLRKLEEDLGCQLMLRTPRGVVPTESGRRLAQQASVILQQVNALRDEVRGLEAVPTGPASIGIPTSLGPLLTVPLALAVRRLYPSVHLRVVEGLSGHMLEWLHGGEVDLAMVFGAEGVPGLATEFIACETLSLVAPLDDPLIAGRAQVDLNDILHLPMILPSRPHGVREEVEQAALRVRRSLNVVMEIDALEQIKALVAEGAGYTVVSERVASGGIISQRLARLPIINPQIERRIFLAHASSHPLSLAAQAVRTQVQAQLQGLIADGYWRVG